MKRFQSRQKFAWNDSLIFVVITLLIMSSPLAAQIPGVAVATASDEEDGESGDSGWLGMSPNRVLRAGGLELYSNSNCSQTPIASIVTSYDEDEDDEVVKDEDDDEDDEDDEDRVRNVLDDNFDTEWSTEGLGSFLQLDMGSVKEICSLDVSWSEGDEKTNNFVLSLSKDGATFEDVLRTSSSGTTEFKERYEFSPSDSRYLRITFYGNSENDDEVTIREMAVNSRSLQKPETTAIHQGKRDGMPLVEDSQSSTISTLTGNYTNGSKFGGHSAPIVSDIHAMVTSAASFEILLNSSDTDLIDHITYYVVELPQHGNLSAGTSAASVRYTPAEGYSGLDNFTYRAVDKYGLASKEATVYIDINPSNHSAFPEVIDLLRPKGEAILEGQTDRYEQIKASREPIRGQYIVVLRPNVTEMTADSDSARIRADQVRAMAEETRIKGAQILDIYEHALDGYVIKASENMSSELVSELRRDPRVAYVEPDQRVYALEQSIPVGIDRVDGDLSQTVSGDGSGAVDADVAILDTGIDLTHPDLNIYHEKTFIAGTSSADDDNGHGTHVAGIVGAEDNAIGVVGIAPGARLWAIKVLDSSGAGSISDIIAGIDYVTGHSNEIDVVNLSFGCECSSPALDAAIGNAVQAGITFVVAAGNDNKDASSFSPARNPNVIAVSAMADSDGKCGGEGSSTKYGGDDTFASFSNYGEPVDLTAPGVDIFSTYSDGKYAKLSGTSMAAPHVAGGIALYKSSHPGASPAQVKAALADNGIEPASGCAGGGQGYFTGDPDSANRPLLNVRGF